MAQDLSQTARKAYRLFHERFMDHRAWYAPFTDEIVLENYDTTYREADVFGIAEAAAMSATPTPQDLKSSASETTTSDYEIVVKVSIPEAEDNPGLLLKAGETALSALNWTLAKAVRDALLGLPTTVHPEDSSKSYESGVYAAQGGGTVYFADAFTITPPTGSAFNQQNLYSDAFGETELSRALSARRQYKTKSGLPAAMADERPFLLVGPDWETEAWKLYRRTAELYTGSGTGAGGWDGRIQAPIVFPGTISSANSDVWALIWSKMESDAEGNSMRTCPVMPVLKGMPRLAFTEADSSHYLYVKVLGRWGIHYRTFEGDIQYHSGS